MNNKGFKTKEIDVQVENVSKPQFLLELEHPHFFHFIQTSFMIIVLKIQFDSK